MNNALETLFVPLNTSPIEEPSNILFLGAQYHKTLQQFTAQSLDLIQPFKPHADALESNGFKPQPDLSLNKNKNKSYDLILILCPKNITETRYLLALACTYLKENGTLLCAADNKAGGTRIKKNLTTLGFQNITEDSKHKARVCRATTYKQNHITEEWLKSGQPQPVLNNMFQSRPGIFGWDKIDKGSEILINHLPQSIKGHGADYGCGYGYLSHHLLSTYRKIKTLHAIDADWRALEACRANLTSEKTINFLWQDLTQNTPPVINLDFVVMNPPFHEGKTESKAIGIACIENAYKALKRKGTLYMVANAHLPYEHILKERFYATEKLCEGKGFKAFIATK